MRASTPWCFFCVVTPGLEELALEEYRAKRLALGTTVEAMPLAGGFEVTLPWEQGRALTMLLKIPTRVMVRLTNFKARDFPTLFQKASNLPWTKWIGHPEPLWKISAHQCRLMHTGRVEESLREALQKAHGAHPFSQRWQKENIAPETLYVRGIDDVWSFSLDISGEALYKRGTSIVKGEAPMRETLAAAVLRFMFEGQAESVHLWDPMCGSGTFLFEAKNHALPTQREYPWEKSILNLGVPAWKLQSALVGLPLAGLYGHDLDEKLIKKLPHHQGFNFGQHDLLKAPARPVVEPLWAVSNPPYGERLAVEGGVDHFARALGESLSKLGLQRVCLVVPTHWPVVSIAGLIQTRRLSFSNGGIAVEARVWDRG